MDLPLHRPQRAIRSVEIGPLLDTFLVCSVSTILIIRLQLWLTHYPQLGGGKLHIAHLLWGGGLMLVALILLLGFVGRSRRVPAAVIGGAGFGFFIDEVGKFVTSDNDYFFKPSAAIIYIVFIALYLVTRSLQLRRGFTPREYLVNAVDMLTEAARRDLDAREKERTAALLDRTDPADPLVKPLRRLLAELQTVPTPEASRLRKLAAAVRERYLDVVEEHWFPAVIAVVFLLRAVLSLVQDVVLVVSRGHLSDLSFISWALVVSSLVAIVLTAIGLLRLYEDRMEAYRWLERSLLVGILATQVFAFVRSQFSAVFGLGINLLLLITLRAMMRTEQRPELAAGTRTR